MKLRTGSKALIREINESLVLDLVRARGTVARGVIANETGLSPATVTGITGRLVKAGLLVEKEVQRGTGGRPARLLTLGREVTFAAGVRLTTNAAYVVLVDLAGEIVADHREALASTGVADAAAAITRAVHAVTERQPGGELIGVGVAVSGIVNQSTGTVRHSGALGWEDEPLRDELSRLLDATVIVDSHVNALASAGLLYDGRLEGKSLIVFSVGQSLGASVVVDGGIHRGFDGTAGGFAHGRADGSDRPCHCGARGCLETWGSRWGIERELERRDVLGGLNGPAEAVERVLQEAGEQLGIAMANASKMFGPERVVVAFAPELDFPSLSDEVVSTFQREFRHGNTVAPELDVFVGVEAEVAKGAAYEVLSRLFTTDVAEIERTDFAAAMA